MYTRLLKLLARTRVRYRTLFSIEEIESQTILQWFFGAMLLFFYVTFYQWIGFAHLNTDSSTVCWPYFLDCNALHFFARGDYTQNMFYMALFAVMLLSVYLIYRKRWVEAHALMLGLFLWKFISSFLLSWGIAGVYDYYHLILTAALLFLPYKEYFAKLLFVLLYFLSSTIKFNPAWTLGTYFSALESGLPIFPDALLPLFTMSVIFEQVVGCWFLLSKHKTVQRLTLAYFVVFHLYAGVLVQFNYSTISLPAILILFGPLYRYQAPPLTKKAIAGWLMVAVVFLFQTPVHFIQGDEKLTMEGYRFGMWMFDANHQCVSEYTVHYADGKEVRPYSFRAVPGTPCAGSTCVTLDAVYRSEGSWVRTLRVESPKAEVRCSPYTAWRTHLGLCREDVERVSFTFDHSVNGDPFYRIVDEENMCDLSYKTWSHNEWIKEPPEAPAIGIPAKNIYY